MQYLQVYKLDILIPFIHLLHPNINILFKHPNNSLYYINKFFINLLLLLFSNYYRPYQIIKNWFLYYLHQIINIIIRYINHCFICWLLILVRIRTRIRMRIKRLKINIKFNNQKESKENKYRKIIKMKKSRIMKQLKTIYKTKWILLLNWNLSHKIALIINKFK